MNLRSTPLAATLFSTLLAPLAAFQPTAYAETPASESSLPEVTIHGTADKKDFAPYTSTIGGKTPTAIRDIPQTVTVVNKAVLESQAATSMTEALRNVPGITISAGEGGQIGDNINLRGFSSRTDIFMDGFRDRGQYTRDIFFLDAVEVLKGPSSMQFGRGSTGGVINQSSKKASLEDSNEVTGSIGTDQYYRATVDVNKKLSDTSAFRLSALAHNNESTRDVIENKRYGIAPTLRLGIGTPTEITLSALIQRNDDIPDYGIPFLTTGGAGTLGTPINVSKNRYYGFTDDEFKQDINIFNATIRHKFSPSLTLVNRTQYGKYKTTASPTPLAAPRIVGGGVPTQSTPLDQVEALYSTRDRIIDDSSIFNQTDLLTKIQLAGMQHNIVTGIELGYDKFKNEAYTWIYPGGSDTVNFANPVSGSKPAGSTRNASTLTEASATSAAIYANDQIDITKQWKLVGGLRWDYFRANYSQINLATSATTRPGPKVDEMLSTRAGVIWQPDDAQSYYISYGTSFNPSAETLTLTTAATNLDPEKNRSFEIGGKWDLLEGRLSLNSAAFRVEKTNMRTPDLTNSAIQVLDGKARVQGIELGAIGRITPVWQVLAGYTFLDGEVIESREATNIAPAPAAPVFIYTQGKTLQNTPRHNVTLWTTYNFLGNWEAGGGLIYASDRYVNNYETAKIDGYTRVDATLAYKQKSYDIRLNLQNLTNKDYFEAASGGATGTGRAVPAKGRGAILTAAYRF